MDDTHLLMSGSTTVDLFRLQPRYLSHTVVPFFYYSEMRRSGATVSRVKYFFPPLLKMFRFLTMQTRMPSTKLQL